MKSSFLILAYTLCSLFAIAQGNKKIEIAALVKITEKADFISLSKLVAQQGYIVLDSSVLANGSFNYITKEPVLKGNTIGCWANSKYEIEGVSFITYRKELYEDLKHQIILLKFNSGGVQKGKLPDMIETEEFEKGNLLISTGVKKSLGDIVYEFIFLKW